MDNYNFDTEFDTEAIDWQGGKALYQWWLHARRTRAFPARIAFSPEKFTEFLPTVVMVNVHRSADNTPSYSIRLAGTKHVEVMGYDPTHYPLSKVPNNDYLQAKYDWIIAHKKPVIVKKGPLAWVNKNYRFYSAIALPLGRDDTKVDMVISHVNYI